MSALSGITVSPDLASAFADAVQSSSTRFIKILIQNESLVHDISIPIDGSFEQDLEQLQRDDILPADSPAYILAKVDPPSSDWISIYYVPDTAQVREKMLYASTRVSFMKSLGSTLFTDSIFATSKTDLTAEAYVSHVRHNAAPHPLSKREQELADLRATENKAATYEGSRAKASHIGSGVGLNWSEEVEKAVTDLGGGVGNGLVIIAIDTKSETLVLHFSGDIEADSLSTSLPSSEPCYALFSWPNTSETDNGREVVFIYSCPSEAPIKNRMIYSSGSTSTYEAAKNILTSLIPPIAIASRKIETSNPKELMSSTKSGIAVYCGSSSGNRQAFAVAAKSLGLALAKDGRPLVYGGGSKGIMGVVSSGALEGGGRVIGVVPQAMVAGGGEDEKVSTIKVHINEAGREKVETIVVDTMHERKVEMAKRAEGFVGLPGGFGTFEEVLEVTTWTQLGIHDKPVVLLNVLSFWEPLRTLIKSGIDAGFIKPASERLIHFIDGPQNHEEHESFDWGKATLEALDNWERGRSDPLFVWSTAKTTYNST
ncbi:hypothetical protein CVT25_011324 [Psilocybe cyanescens]|uniref:ADF-H domain-containing protein n=1 Tax=Psilocybe cyanescens TaxID=93625 RepID=A0A409WGA5_PSICY|nr:hypothetical protein CVT25_011324 [Psilocybe cyanescens]